MLENPGRIPEPFELVVSAGVKQQQIVPVFGENIDTVVVVVPRT
jgi:hypothetical protein